MRQGGAGTGTIPSEKVIVIFSWPWLVAKFQAPSPLCQVLAPLGLQREGAKDRARNLLWVTSCDFVVTTQLWFHRHSCQMGGHDL